MDKQSSFDDLIHPAGYWRRVVDVQGEFINQGFQPAVAHAKAIEKVNLLFKAEELNSLEEQNETEF